MICGVFCFYDLPKNTKHSQCFSEYLVSVWIRRKKTHQIHSNKLIIKMYKICTSCLANTASLILKSVKFYCMNQSLGLLFYLKKPKRYEHGPLPIYVRVTIAEQRFEFSLKRKCLLEKWNAHTSRMTGSKEDARTLNTYIDNIHKQVHSAYNSILSTKSNVTALDIKNKLTGTAERPNLLLEIFRHHNEQFKALVGSDYSEGTYKKYKTCLVSLDSFIRWKYKTVDLNVKEVGNEFITSYEFYLKSVQKVAHNTAMGYIKKLKKIIKQCLANDWIEKDPFIAYKMRTKEVNRGFLTEEEINTIRDKAFGGDRLSKVRDLFLFSCYTGLSYADVVKLTPADLVIANDQEKWICTNRTKTKTAAMIPLLPPAGAIINKYSKYPDIVAKGRILPKLSNERINSYLKEIADVCHISKRLTFHIARHTFATTITLSNGVSIESVSKMLGHKNLRTTQVYAKIMDSKVNNDMQILKKRYVE